MRKTLLAASLVVMAAGCSSLVDRFNPLGPDPVKQQIATMKDTAMVPWAIPFHTPAKVGQFALVKTPAGETWTGIVAGQAGAWTVEKRDVVPGDKKMYTTVMIVDDQGVVAKAFAAPYAKDAKEKPKAEAVKVLEKPKPVEGAAAPKGPEPKWSKDTINGQEVDRCDVDKATCWFSKDALFAVYLAEGKADPHGGMIKSAYEGNVDMELVKQGEEASALSCVLP
jgi:hypothetical protein